MWPSGEGIPGWENCKCKGLRRDHAWNIEAVARRRVCLGGREAGDETE